MNMKILQAVGSKAVPLGKSAMSASKTVFGSPMVRDLSRGILTTTGAITAYTGITYLGERVQKYKSSKVYDAAPFYKRAFMKCPY
jgi:hypothetical protein